MSSNNGWDEDAVNNSIIAMRIVRANAKARAKRKAIWKKVKNWIGRKMTNQRPD
tara:strand:- start:480 stop:641 length:162 start_codon:yes stop_codon:yes gene_type:complete